jgi:SNF2 family DNA or RNA helicase
MLTHSEKCSRYIATDMGLGKTVQTVALIAALLQKTGTEYDRLVLSRRQAQAEKRRRRLQLEKEQSLMAGCPYTRTDTYEDMAKELGLPAMGPILVVCPKNVGTKCFCIASQPD